MNKNTCVFAAIEVNDVIDAMIEEQYVITDEEKQKLCRLMFNSKGDANKYEMLGNAVEFINSYF